MIAAPLHEKRACRLCRNHARQNDETEITVGVELSETVDWRVDINRHQLPNEMTGADSQRRIVRPVETGSPTGGGEQPKSRNIKTP